MGGERRNIYEILIVKHHIKSSLGNRAIYGGSKVAGTGSVEVQY
jgi:hypothetical protein